MLKIFQSNSIDTLKKQLIGILYTTPLNHPFIDEQILVHSPGMAQWLQQQIALSSGIAAAVKFPMPASFIWHLFQKLLPDVPEVSAFSKEAMTWKIMHLLPECLQDPAYAPLKHYLNNQSPKIESSNAEGDEQGITGKKNPVLLGSHDDSAITQVKAYQLAAKIADTFDQYLVYRPEWISRWEQEDNLEEITKHQAWQPLLWRNITAHTLTQQQSHWHRGNLYTALVSELYKAKNTSLSHSTTLPKRLFVFGISTLPPAYLQVLKAISEHIDVYLMVHNPCQFYWGDTKNPRYASHNLSDEGLQFSENFLQEENTALDEGNTLLASMGRLGRDYHALLSEVEAIEEECFTDPVETFCENSHPPTVLAQIQSHILNLEEPIQPSAPSPADNSLVINSCHSPLREAEILHDYLLHLLENNSSLTPKDIIIMAPDVEIYSPAIQAVFSSTPPERAIPFAISDRNARRENPMLEALLKLLNSYRLRYTINDIMSLLEVPAIMRCYSIEPQQLSTLQQWVTDSGIRWGLDTAQQATLPSDQNTWRFGLERLLLGYAIEGTESIYEHRLPAQNIEGLNASLCGLLMEFIDQLTWLSNTLNTARTASEWAHLLNQILDRFFLPDAIETPALQMVRDTFTSLCEQTDSARFEQSISHSVMLEWLTERLDQYKGSQRFLSGKINVCTLMPMRSIPFKVICLLGMNDGAYPRSIPPGSFDLISKHPRRGDRSRRDDDRYLFLEALLAAENHLYISYNGRNIKDNAVRTPSVLLSELTDYCHRHFIKPLTAENNEHNWVTQHPLQPFSPKYFQSSDSYFTYAQEWLSAAAVPSYTEPAAFIETALPLKESTTSLDLDELLRFYRHPCKYFFQQRLGVIFKPMETLPEDSEPFSLTGLDNFNLQAQLLEQQLNDIPIEKSLSLIKASGQLPHSHFGTFAMQTLQHTVENMASMIKPYLSHPEANKEVRLDINNQQLSGWIKGIYNDSLIRYRPSKNKNKLLVSCLIEHLAWCASSDNPGETRIFYLPQQKKQDTCTVLRPISQQQSRDELEKLFALFQQGQSEPLPFFPSTSATWIQLSTDGFQRTRDDVTLTQAWHKTKEAFEKEMTHDDYIKRVWPEVTTPLLDRVAEIAETLLLPLATHSE